MTGLNMEVNSKSPPVKKKLGPAIVKLVVLSMLLMAPAEKVKVGPKASTAVA